LKKAPKATWTGDLLLREEGYELLASVELEHPPHGEGEGFFLFPLQFGIWFLASKVGIVFFPNLHFFEIFYLLFLKICLILTILSPRP